MKNKQTREAENTDEKKDGHENDGDIGQNRSDIAGADKEEIGRLSGPEPTRYGDWTINGRCIDF